MTELSREMSRQIGILADRSGNILSVIVGDHREIMIPDLSKLCVGRRGLRGIRCFHTHLKNEPLTHDDLTDLALLRLDLMGALGVSESGLPADLYLAHLLPPNPQGKVYEIHPPKGFYHVSMNFALFMTAIEAEFDHQQGWNQLGDMGERAILVSVATTNKISQEEMLDELSELARSAHISILGQVIQRPSAVHPKYLMGEGKLRELVVHALQKRADLLIFNQDLTPLQVKAIAEITEMKVIDRTQLILDIFAHRATTREGKVQVELAQLRYRLPRLAERSTALSRLTGGIGGRGPGETRLEVDRRRVRDKITRLERELQELGVRRIQQRQRRIVSNIPIFSIIGYTNAGKSSLLNTLTYSHVATQNLLFSTLDTSTRRLRFPRDREVLITDTVGFIQDIPQDLLGAFRSTLDELSDADLLIHLVDISHPQCEHQMATVDQLLRDLGLFEKPRLLVFNKIDRVAAPTVKAFCERYQALAVSALDQNTLSSLLTVFEEIAFSAAKEKTIQGTAHYDKLVSPTNAFSEKGFKTVSGIGRDNVEWV